LLFLPKVGAICHNVSIQKMEIKIAEKKQKRVLDATLNNKILDSIKEISELVYTTRDGKYISELENLEQTYRNILKYSFGYATDPEREKIFKSLKRKIIELNDDVVANIVESGNNWYAIQKKSDIVSLKLGEQEKSELIDEMSVEREFSSFLKEVESIDDSNLEGQTKYNNTLEQVFHILWLTNRYSEGEKVLAKKTIEANHIPVYDKCLIVSAITLSNLRHFDHTKAEILFDIYSSGEVVVKHRALVGLAFTILQYENRLSLYPELMNRLKSYEDPKELGNQLEQIILQIIRAQETEKVTQKIQEEIIPEVMKLRPDIEEKLKLDELLDKDNMEDKNPDWQEFFSDTPDVYKKLEEFSMMQMDGSDVFMGAFSMLKRFGFFEKLTNWFLPFYKEHPEIQKSIKGVEDNFDWDGFFEGIEQAPVMCNSDKYSFSFNIGFMPDMQKSMMLDMFSAELQQMKEVTMEESKHNSKAQDKIYFTQYIQDLYRFFKLHPQKSSFQDVFKQDLDIANSEVFSLVLSEENIRNVGEFYFQNDYFEKAKQIFFKLLKKERKFELIEKIGFCFQKIGNFEEAINYYKQAEIIETNRTWLHKKLGYCYRSIGEFDKAIEYYTKVEYLEPENLEVQILLGQLNIDKEEYDTALKYYFKVEYLKPDLVKVQRPIAWCSFLLNKTEQAIRYFKKVIDTEGQRSDFLNLGHCLWVKGDIQDAIGNYREAVKRSGGDTGWFSKAISSDTLYLKKFGIDALDISLMADYVIID
jgi:tetratricopeptide (TPR) repeat protein